MKIRNLQGYEICAYSLKRKNAPWRVTSGCDNRARLFTGRHYELPNHTACMTCPFYRRTKAFLNGRNKSCFLGVYARKLAEHLSHVRDIAAGRPSILAAGPANFPARKEVPDHREAGENSGGMSAHRGVGFK